MSASADLVLYEVEDGIAVITLNRPDRLNALIPGMGDTYAALLRRADADPEVRVIVVTGAGRGFCSGADLGVLAEGREALDGYLDGQSADTLPTVALQLGTPVVTAINGPCAGIGFVLAIAADRRFAQHGATLATSFARLGLIAEYGVAWLLPRLVGISTATELLMTARAVPAEEALTLGLVDDVSDDALAAAMTWARQLAASSSPTALAIIKSQLLDADRQTMEQAAERSLVEMRASFRRDDLAEAIAARLEGREVRFAGYDGTVR